MNKQLVFDCRYGWVYDEWRDPSTVAHLGGRGMFSIVPLTRAAVIKTVDLTNRAADMAAGIIQDPSTFKICFKHAHVKAQNTYSSLFKSIPFALGRFSNQSKDNSSAYSFELIESKCIKGLPMISNVQKST